MSPTVMILGQPSSLTLKKSELPRNDLCLWPFFRFLQESFFRILEISSLGLQRIPPQSWKIILIVVIAGWLWLGSATARAQDSLSGSSSRFGWTRWLKCSSVLQHSFKRRGGRSCSLKKLCFLPQNSSEGSGFQCHFSFCTILKS